MFGDAPVAGVVSAFEEEIEFEDAYSHDDEYVGVSYVCFQLAEVVDDELPEVLNDHKDGWVEPVKDQMNDALYINR